MPRFKVGLNVAAETIPYFVELAEAAEQSGIDNFWAVDSQLRFRDPFVALTAAAARTQKIILGTMVVNPVTRHFSVLAGTIATLDEVSKSRMILGIGRGYTSVHTIGDKPCSVTELEYAVRMIRSLLTGEKVASNGGEMKLFARREVPLYVGTSGMKTMKLAGELGDGAFLQFGAQPGVLKYAGEKIKEAAKNSARDSSAIELVGYVSCSINNDKAKAVKAVKYMISSLVSFAGPSMLSMPSQEADFSHDELRRVRSALDFSSLSTNPAEYHRKVDQVITDQVASKLAVVGSPSQCAERLAEIVGSGVTQLCVNLQPPDDRPNQLRMLVRDVLPSL